MINAVVGVMRAETIAEKYGEDGRRAALSFLQSFVPQVVGLVPAQSYPIGDCLVYLFEDERLEDIEDTLHTFLDRPVAWRTRLGAGPVTTVMLQTVFTIGRVESPRQCAPMLASLRKRMRGSAELASREEPICCVEAESPLEDAQPPAIKEPSLLLSADFPLPRPWDPQNLEWRQAAEADPAIVFVLDRDIQLRYCNLAWDRFAMLNNAHESMRERAVGRYALLGMFPALCDFLAQVHHHVLRTGEEWEIRFTKPDEFVQRHYRLHVSRGASANAVIAIAELQAEEPHPPAEDSGGPDLLRGRAITLCDHCRRTPVSLDGSEWVLRPGLLALDQTLVSRELCPSCEAYFHELAVAHAMERFSPRKIFH